MPLFPWFARKSATVTDGLTVYDLLSRLGTGTKSGKSINHRVALQVPTVFACARVYGNGLAQPPWKLMRKDGRDRKPAEDHPLYTLISLRPNEWQTSFEFRQMIGLHIALGNEAFVYKVYVRNKLVELLPFPPSDVTKKQNDDRSISYRIRLARGGFEDVEAKNIWHIRNMTWDGVNGLDAVNLVRESIGLSLSAEEHGSKFYANGAQVNGILSTDKTMNETQAKTLRDSWTETYAGAENSGKTAILWGGMKYQPLAMQADQSQYNETRKQQVEEICRGFGVLPIMVGYSDKTATYASAEAMFQAHVTYTLLPLFEMFDQSAAVNLLSSDEIASGYYFHLNANGLLRGSVKDRGEFYWKQFQMGAFSPNDIRELEDQNPYVGGDQRFVPANVVPIEKSGQIAPMPAPAKTEE